MKYHLACTYHGELGAVDSDSAADQSAKQHITKKHADSSGKIAAGAEVTVREVRHIGAADLANVQASPFPPQK